MNEIPFRIGPARPNRSERGMAMVIVAFSLSLLLLLMALGVDLGFAFMVRTQLQNASDAAALAGAGQLIDEDILAGFNNKTDDILQARQSAADYAFWNESTGDSRLLDLNSANSTNGDIVAGFLNNPADLNDILQTATPSTTNSIQVTIRRTSAYGNPVELFFSKGFGAGESQVLAQSTATLDNRIIGIQHQSGSSEFYPVLPFALNKCDFYIKFNQRSDNFEYCEVDRTFYSGSDGIPEIKMYPYKLNEDPDYINPAGNFGTIDIGNYNNSTADIERQIMYGITGSELDTIGGLILQQGCGSLWSKYVNGDTGISTAIKDELADIIGEERILPLFDELSNPGNNAYYRLVSFVPVRVVKVKMTGSLSSRYVLVQPFQGTYMEAVAAASAPANGFLHRLSLTR